MHNPGFLLTTCQQGAEKALKGEMLRDYPDFRFSYSRPGFVTFKSLKEQRLQPDFELKTIFARTYSVFIEKFKGDLKENEIIEKTITCAKALSRGKLRLHVWENENLTKALLACAHDLFYPDTQAQAGDTVLDLILVDKNEFWLGCHFHGSGHSPFPGGQPKIEMHPEAPSRAYLKIEEALLWSKAPLQRDDTAVELGSAPGGAAFSLLNRGLHVVGIDPAEMDPIIKKKFQNQFQHIQRPIADVFREDLPESVQWLLLDMNIAPQFSLFAVDKLVVRMKDSLLGVLLTLKLNQWKMASEIPQMLEHVREMGIRRLRAAQLSQNRQEFVIFGLTQKGLRRVAVTR